MKNIIELAESLLAGVYTTVGVHYYSIIVSKLRNGFLRTLVFLITVGVCFGGGMVLLVFINDGATNGLAYLLGTWLPHGNGGMRYLTFACWIGVLIGYAILNNRKLQARLKYPKGASKYHDSATNNDR